MRVKEKVWQQLVAAPLPQVWSFFSKPQNLNELTPDDLSFKIISPAGEVDMYPGMLIRYRVKPLFGISLFWMTEITQVREGEYFIDEQRMGPYAFWHHQHHFEKVDGGVLITDRLHYKVPFGPLGTLVDKWIVEPRIEEIFRFRKQKVDQIFGPSSSE
ncbi:MAG: SRPBCC family protein [Saprospiraceae bacterium]|nr:SRPBCC family protein [Saprospiraceae bacterium]